MADLTPAQTSELQKIASGLGIGYASWVFAPLCWGLLHQRGFINVTFDRGRLSAVATPTGRAALEREKASDA